MANLAIAILVYMSPKPYSPNSMITATLATGLTVKEFACKCEYESCDITLVADTLRTSYEAVRTSIDHPLIINSGHRCQKHNEDEEGSPTSSHTKGLAIDISYKGLSSKKKDELVSLCLLHFDYTEANERFVHCHNLE